jgi:hypothetical protein
VGVPTTRLLPFALNQPTLASPNDELHCPLGQDFRVQIGFVSLV